MAHYQDEPGGEGENSCAGSAQFPYSFRPHAKAVYACGHPFTGAASEDPGCFGAGTRKSGKEITNPPTHSTTGRWNAFPTNEYYTCGKEPTKMITVKEIEQIQLSIEQEINEIKALAQGRDMTDNEKQRVQDLLDDFQALEISKKRASQGRKTEPMDPGHNRPGVIRGGREGIALQTVSGEILPLLRPQDRLADAAGPVQSGLADLVLSMAGRQARNQMVQRQTGLIETALSSAIIDDVRLLTPFIEGGTGTLPISGPTNVCRVLTDATVIEHVEAVSDVSDSAPTFDAVTLDPKSLVVNVPITVESLEDSVNLERVLRTSLAKAFAVKVTGLAITSLLANGSIPSSDDDPASWGATLLAVADALAADQRLPAAMVSNPADFMGRASQTGAPSGLWLGVPPVLASMKDLFTSAMTEGKALFGDFSTGLVLAVRRDLSVEVIRHAKPSTFSHLLVAYARMAIYCLQPKALFWMGISESV
jgi:HK97 family phage major capsid protein